MFKKVFFCFTSVLLILASLYVIFHVDIIVKLQSESALEIVEDYETVKEIYETENLKTTFLFCASIQSILGIYIFIQAMNEKLLQKKSRLILIYVIYLFTSILLITSLISILSIIVLLCLKQNKSETDSSKEKLPLPEMEEEPLTQKSVILGILLSSIYFSQIFVEQFLPNDISKNMVIIISVIYYLILFVLAIGCLITIFKNHFITFFHHKKAYLQHVLGIIGIMYLIYYSLTVAVFLITGYSSSVNQTSIEELPMYITAPLAILFAPIVEETIFRGLLQKLIKNQTEFIVVSGLLFGVLHVMYETELLEALSLAVPYTILGLFFAYIYARTKNLSTSIGVHALHNAIGVLFLFLSHV